MVNAYTLTWVVTKVIWLATKLLTTMLKPCAKIAHAPKTKEMVKKEVNKVVNKVVNKMLHNS